MRIDVDSARTAEQGPPLTPCAFWRTCRSSMIQQYRAAVASADQLPDGYADALLHQIRVVERYINKVSPDAQVAPFNPALPPARVRRHRQAFAAGGQRV